VAVVSHARHRETRYDGLLGPGGAKAERFQGLRSREQEMTGRKKKHRKQTAGTPTGEAWPESVYEIDEALGRPPG
jgi:hypothetical protein